MLLNMIETRAGWMQCSFIVATLVVGGCSDDAEQGQDDAHASSTSESDGTGTGGPTTSGTTATQPTDDGSTTIGEPATDTDAADGSTTMGDGTGNDETDGTGDTVGVTLSGVVTNLASGDPLANVSVCVYDHPRIDCATTNGAGMYTLPGVPVGEGAIEFQGGGVFPGLFHGVTSMDDTLNYFALDALAATIFAAALGEQLDPARGHLGAWAVDANGEPLANVSFALSPESGAGPGYITPQSSIDPELTATTEVGFAGWVNVDPGEVQITATHPTLSCTPHASAIAGDDPNGIRMDIVAGRLGTTFPFVCD